MTCWNIQPQMCIRDRVQPGEKVKVVGVKDHKTSFLKYLDSIPLAIEQTIEVKEKIEFDDSLIIKLNDDKSWTLTATAAENILVKSI